MWDTFTIAPGYTFITSDVLWTIAVVAALIFALRRFA